MVDGCSDRDDIPYYIQISIWLNSGCIISELGKKFTGKKKTHAGFLKVFSLFTKSLHEPLKQGLVKSRRAAWAFYAWCFKAICSLTWVF